MGDIGEVSFIILTGRHYKLTAQYRPFFYEINENKNYLKNNNQLGLIKYL